MERTEIFTKLKEILVSSEIATEEELLNVTEESSLTDDLGLNSISMLFTVISIEDTFGIQFSDVSVTELRTVSDIISCIMERI